MKITPVLFVKKVEESLPFWVDRIGFEKTVEVPGEDGLAFVILVHEGAELMLQSIASVLQDEPKFAPTGLAGGTSLFLEVADFEDILKRLEGYPIEMPERTTNYGMREIGVRDPDGHIAIFAKPTA
jgi:catechol 2,3-dioxygenase-like lactoylglutathione lyase family enzyme